MMALLPRLSKAPISPVQTQTTANAGVFSPGSSAFHSFRKGTWWVAGAAMPIWRTIQTVESPSSNARTEAPRLIRRTWHGRPKSIQNFINLHTNLNKKAKMETKIERLYHSPWPKHIAWVSPRRFKADRRRCWRNTLKSRVKRKSSPRKVRLGLGRRELKE